MLSVADQAASGSLSVKVTNPGPGGGTSPAASIAVNSGPVSITSLSPASLSAATTTETTVSVSGQNFLPNAMVQVNGQARTTTFLSSSALSFQATVADQSAVANLSVVVVNPDGKSSPTVTLPVVARPSTPLLSQISPSSFYSGDPDTVVYLYGSFFTASTTVQFGTTSLPVTNFSTNRLTVTVPASILVSAGSFPVTATTPTAFISVSNALTATVTNPPAPVISPSTFQTGGPINSAMSITVSGSNFSARTGVTINGLNVPITSNGGSSLSFTIPATAIPTPGNYTVSVTVPPPGGGTASFNFTAYIPLVSNDMVYNVANGLLYASVPGSVGVPIGNSIVSVDPLTGAIGKPIAVGSEPDKLALTADGRYLWVVLDGSSSVRRVDLTTGLSDASFSIVLPNSDTSNGTSPYVFSIAALPNAPNSILVEYGKGNTFLSIYDSGILRGSAGTGTIYSGAFYGMATDPAVNEVYLGGTTLDTYTFNSTGLSLRADNNATVANSTFPEMQLLRGKIYTDFSTVLNAETGSLLGTFYSSGTTVSTGPQYTDAALGKTFILSGDSTFGLYDQFLVYSSSTYATTGASIPVFTTAPSGYASAPSRVVRWGANGLAFHQPYGIYSVRSNSIADISSINADLGLLMSAPATAATGDTTSYTIKATNAGPSAASDVALILQAPVTGSIVSATSSIGTCDSTGMRCDLGQMASGNSATVTVSVRQVTAGAATMTATVSGSTTDPVDVNNTANATTIISGTNYNLSPAISSLAPAAIQSGSLDTTVTVNGSGFSASSVALIDGVAAGTTFVSSTQLSVMVPAAKLATVGWSALSVSNPLPGGGNSNPSALSVFSVLALNANSLVFDPYSQRLIASIDSASTALTGNSVVAIDPVTAIVGTPVSVGSEPGEVALSSSGNKLYVVLPTVNEVARFNMQTNSLEYAATLPVPSTAYLAPTPFRVEALPGSEDTILAVINNYSTSQFGIFDANPSARSFVLRGGFSYTSTHNCLQFRDSTNLFAFIDSSSYLEHGVVSSAGLAYDSTGSPLKSWGCGKFAANLAVTELGGVADTTTLPAIQVGILPGLTGQYLSYDKDEAALAADPSLKRSFIGITPSTQATFGLKTNLAAYDLSTFLQTDLLPMPFGSIESDYNTVPVQMLRWGQDGLALLMSSGRIYLLRGPFVVPQLMVANSAAVLTSYVTSVSHASGNILLTLNGTNFLPGVAVTWNGAYRTTTIVDATHLTVAIPASDLTAAGTATLAATNPGSTASAPLTVIIN